MHLRQLALATLLAATTLAATAQDKVVYHINDTATQALGTLRNIRNHLDTDPGARYIGEWSIGVNPMVLHPMKDTLFDEKIAGSFHFLILPRKMSARTAGVSLIWPSLYA